MKFTIEAAEDIGLRAENIHELDTDSSSCTPMISNPLVLFAGLLLCEPGAGA